MPALTNYKISFTQHGFEQTLYISAEDCGEAHKWRYVADSLGILYRSDDGSCMLSHAIRNLVEARGVSEVRVQALVTPLDPQSQA
ncbi:hypothetical protein ACCD10_16095 [Pseudomonas sp. Pseusp122]|uniref:hypothetical protein n=1 Tax=unclassified Pseudomonas TaxID=196821 RepID=UPI0039A50F4C